MGSKQEVTQPSSKRHDETPKAKDPDAMHSAQTFNIRRIRIGLFLLRS